jgi:hypothetical protein
LLNARKRKYPVATHFSTLFCESEKRFAGTTWRKHVMAKNKNHSLFLLFLVPIKTNDRGEGERGKWNKGDVVKRDDRLSALADEMERERESSSTGKDFFSMHDAASPMTSPATGL